MLLYSKMGTFREGSQRVRSEPVRETGRASVLHRKIDSVRAFAVQRGPDHSDFGSDYRLEARDGVERTNVRVHVQLKGTGGGGECRWIRQRVSSPESNLKYLLGPVRLAVCLLPTSRLGRMLVRPAEDLYAEYARSGQPWMDQETVTIRFSEHFRSAFSATVAAVRPWRGTCAREPPGLNRPSAPLPG